ncbi:MAG TPA: response regulator [Pseudobdellovibrionaceae bacterium]|nr:response regulator [Pseudobdellovibrionaceae bacterium]
MSAAKKLANQNERVYKVLVIDDSADSVEMMSRILSNNGCDITMAFDGEDSEVLLSKKEFDLVIVDWNMPNMNGRETLIMMDKILGNQKDSQGKTPSMPVVIYTAEEQENLDLPQCKFLTYVGFINKQQNFTSMSKSCSFILRTI